MAPLTSLCLVLAVASIARADYLHGPRQDGCPTTTTNLPDYLNTSPGPYAGMDEDIYFSYICPNGRTGLTTYRIHGNGLRPFRGGDESRALWRQKGSPGQ